MTVQVLCTRPNASDNINGVPFHETDAGMLSDPISQELADMFIGIPGYELIPAAETTEPAEAPKRRKG